MIRRLGIALAVAALAQGSAHAVAPIAPSHRRAAEETLRTIDVEGSMRTGVSVMVDSMVEGNAMLAPYRSVVVKWAEKFMTWETIGPKLVDLYAETFTEAELRELTAFYRTPVGRKALAAMPDLARRGAEIGTQVARNHQKELEEMVQERAKQLEAATADVP